MSAYCALVRTRLRWSRAPPSIFDYTYFAFALISLRNLLIVSEVGLLMIGVRLDRLNKVSLQLIDLTMLCGDYQLSRYVVVSFIEVAR